MNGRTVLFTIHDMGSIRKICHICLVLDHGKAVHHGDVYQSVQLYRKICGIPVQELPGV